MIAWRNTAISSWMSATICPPTVSSRWPAGRRRSSSLGLSATVTRKDGHHPIIFMQCGPVRYRVDARHRRPPAPLNIRCLSVPRRFVRWEQPTRTCESSSTICTTN